MEALIALGVGLLTACGVYLALRGRTVPVVLGLTLLSSAVNRLPQALVLTAIEISIGMTAFVVMLALRARAELGNDHVDGEDGGA
ncbi:MAG: NADH-quinone oxidoreductase subunit K [Gammaproteobacteria bacterium]